MKIRVLKSDGVIEPYLHTKVLGTLHNALTAVGENDLMAAEQLAEAVTFYLYRADGSHTISVDQIHLLIQSALASTGFGRAAEALSEHRLQRKLDRRRMVVLAAEDEQAEELRCSLWNKSRIVDTLMKNRKMDRLTARAVAAAVDGLKQQAPTVSLGHLGPGELVRLGGTKVLHGKSEQVLARIAVGPCRRLVCLQYVTVRKAHEQDDIACVLEKEPVGLRLFPLRACTVSPVYHIVVLPIS